MFTLVLLATDTCNTSSRSSRPPTLPCKTLLLALRTTCRLLSRYRGCADGLAQAQTSSPQLDPTSLQPLMDNLESQTYETFEKDPVKYAQYKEAVYRALLDRVPDADKDRVTTVVMVVGAGRGPLVQVCPNYSPSCIALPALVSPTTVSPAQASLEAAEKAGRKIHAYAIEKNPNAIVTLHSRNAEQWGNRVRIVAHDMRTWEAPEQVCRGRQPVSSPPHPHVLNLPTFNLPPRPTFW